MSNALPGRWAALFSSRRSFNQEIASAVERGAVWTRDQSNVSLVDVVVDKAPGWLSPLWGTDDRNLYLRRPEGIWSYPLPEWIDDGASVAIWMRVDRNSDERLDDVSGPLMAGAKFRGAGGWWVGDRSAGSIEAWEIDERRHPNAHGLSVAADELGTPLVRTAVEGDGSLLIWAGCAFDRAPAFAREGDFLIATDATSGLRVAYETPPSSPARRALNEGRLRLFYGNRWLEEFSVDARL